MGKLVADPLPLVATAVTVQSYMTYEIPFGGSTLPAFSPATLPSRTAHVLEAIKAAILNGEFKPGTALVENVLAGEFGVSKTPVREALKALEGSGLVVIRPFSRHHGAGAERAGRDGCL